MLFGPVALFLLKEDKTLEISEGEVGVRKKDAGFGFVSHLKNRWRV